MIQLQISGSNPKMMHLGWGKRILSGWETLEMEAWKRSNTDSLRNLGIDIHLLKSSSAAWIMHLGWVGRGTLLWTTLRQMCLKGAARNGMGCPGSENFSNHNTSSVPAFKESNLVNLFSDTTYTFANFIPLLVKYCKIHRSLGDCLCFNILWPTNFENSVRIMA